MDSPFSLAKWAELEGYENLILLSDLGKETARAYDSIYEDLRGMKGVAKRSLFLVDKEGTIVTREIVETPGELPDIEGAIAKKFWEFAPAQEDMFLTDADAFARLMVAVKYFRRDNVKSSDRITSLVDGIAVLVDTAKLQAEQAGSDDEAVVLGSGSAPISDLDKLPVEKDAAVA